MSTTQEDFTQQATRDAYADLEQRKPTIFYSFNALRPISDLWLRLVVAWAFYTSGITKVVTASLLPMIGVPLRYPLSLMPTASTFALFQNEYHVPFLQPHMAAILGTGVEVLMPIFIALGLFGRLAALVLFLFNIVAVISFPLAQSGPAFYLHVLWGTLLLAVMANGPGKISIDHLFAWLTGRR